MNTWADIIHDFTCYIVITDFFIPFFLSALDHVACMELNYATWNAYLQKA